MINLNIATILRLAQRSGREYSTKNLQQALSFGRDRFDRCAIFRGYLKSCLKAGYIAIYR